MFDIATRVLMQAVRHPATQEALRRIVRVATLELVRHVRARTSISRQRR